MYDCVAALRCRDAGLLPERVGIRHDARVDVLRADGRHRLRLLQPDQRVELLGQDGAKVMTLPLRQRPVDDADRTLQSWMAERLAQLAPIIPPIGQ